MKWYKQLESENKLPIVIDKDKNYLPKLEFELNNYLTKIGKMNCPSGLLCELEGINKSILNSIKTYYSGDVISSNKIILDLLVEFKSNPFLYSDLGSCHGFRGLAPLKKVEDDGDEIFRTKINLYKARVSADGNQKFSISEMLHIPCDMRGLVRTQRFSIAGIPCMYFSTSSYGCWLELNKPQDELFNVSSYFLDDNLKVLNLVFNWKTIEEIASLDEREEDYKFDVEQMISDLLKLWPLVCATSFRVDDNNRQFKSEYIISQHIMMSLKQLEIDAVAYHSKRVEYALPNCINLAIPAFESNNRISKFCSNMKISEAVNFREFKYLDASDKHTHKKSYINQFNNYYNHVLLANKSIRYETSVFGQFDNYLCSVPSSFPNVEDLNK